MPSTFGGVWGGFSGARLQNDRSPTLRRARSNTFAVSILSIQKLLDHLMCEATAK
jgi:hypothetical protein